MSFSCLSQKQSTILCSEILTRGCDLSFFYKRTFILDSIIPAAANVQHDPQKTWSLTKFTTPFVRQSRCFGRSTSLISHSLRSGSCNLLMVCNVLVPRFRNLFGAALKPNFLLLLILLISLMLSWALAASRTIYNGWECILFEYENSGQRAWTSNNFSSIVVL